MSFDKDMLALNVVAKLNQEIERLTAELAECRKDADRYRWLRADNAYFPEEKMIMGGVELDAAIDSAMQEAKP